MNSEQNLMAKLMMSKKIMDKHDSIGRGQNGSPNLNIGDSPQVSNFNPLPATYNIPEGLMEQETTKTYNTEVPTQDRIINSRLPEEIKRLMIEHPIEKPTMGVNTNVGISNELVEKASRLMGTNKESNVNTQNQIVNENRMSQQVTSNQDLKTMIRDIVRDTVRDVIREELMEAGMLVESTTNSNDMIQFKVGNHIFLGKVTKVKKIKS